MYQDSEGKALEIHGQITKHISEDGLERYAMRRLPKAALRKVEEHLLICSECRERLEAEDTFQAAIEAAGTMIISMEPKKTQAFHA
jgi:predicted anti-sigma-YlaC factor YlaD